MLSSDFFKNSNDIFSPELYRQKQNDIKILQKLFIYRWNSDQNTEGSADVFATKVSN